MKELDPVWEERRKFGEQCYENIKLLGFGQYLFCDFGAGDLVIHEDKMKVFELYRENMILVSSDMKTKFDPDKRSFWNLLGAGSCMSKNGLLDLIKGISAVICEGSEVVFSSEYCYGEIEKPLETCNMLIYEYVNSKQSKGKYCIAVKK